MAFSCADPGGLDRLTRGDVGFLDRAVARDLERADALFLGDAGGLGCFTRGDAGDFERPIALDLELPRGLLGADALGREAPLAGDAGGFHRLLRLDLGLLHIANLLNFHRPGPLVGGDTLDIDGHGLGDAGLLGRLASRDLGFVDRAGPFDLAPAGFLLVGDAGVGDGAVLLDPRFLDRLARGDLGFLDRPRALDVALAHLALRGNPGGVDRALVGDAGLLDLLAGQQFLFLDGPRTLDLALAGFALGSDTGFCDREFIGNARLLDGLARGELGLFGLGFAQRTFARDFGALQGAAHLDVAFLFEAGGLALALDIQRLPLGVEIAGADLDHRVLLDIVAQLAFGFDVLHQPGQAFGVEPVRRVEIFEVGLVEVGDRHRFQLEAVLGQRFGSGRLDAGDIVAALLVHLLHGHFGGDRADGGNELAGEQGMQLFGLQRPASERGGGDRDGFADRLHADIEIRFDIDAHAVAGDDGVLFRARNAHRQHVHVDRRVVVDERQHEGAAIDHDTFAEEAGANEGDLLRRAVVEPVDDVNADDNRDDRDDQPEDQLTSQNPRHLLLPWSRRFSARRWP